MPTLSTIKRCTKCEHNLPVSSFSKDRSRKDGLCSRCKECISHYDVIYRAANKDKLNAKQADYRAANRDEIKAYMVDWYAANRAELNAKQRAYYRTLRGFTNYLWRNINRRTVNGKYKNWKSKSKQDRRYLNKGIELRITWDELYQFVLLHWDFIQAVWASGESVNLHRPDSSGHYSLDNIQFLAHSVHMKLHGLKNKKAS